MYITQHQEATGCSVRFEVFTAVNLRL